MAKTYRSFKELNGKTLAYGDNVYFGKLHYEVYPDHMNASGEYNTAVFTDQLGFTDDQIDDLLEQMYGYPTGNGAWPQSAPRDYEALTRACLGIYALLDKDPHIEFRTRKNCFRRVELTGFKKASRVKINDDYQAVLGKTALLVGCQKIHYKDLQKLTDKAREEGFIK